MDVTVHLDDETNQPVINQILNLARNGDSDLYEDVKKGWVVFAVAVVRTDRQESGPMPVWAIHKLLTQTEDAPFSDKKNRTERKEVQEILEELESQNLVKSTEDKWSVVTKRVSSTS